jgi:ribonuclease T2
MKNHINQQVSLEEFRAVLDSSLGNGASSHAKLGCKDGLLVDIYINLPAEIKPDANLKELISKAPPAPADKSCQKGFRIDHIGQGVFH